MRTPESYPSKVMLVGEYGLIIGGSALTIPFNKFKMQVRSIGDIPPEKADEAEYSRQFLEKIYQYLSELSGNPFHVRPDMDLFSNNLNRYWIDMNIPTAYGIGSSGAFSAAIYDIFFPGVSNMTLEQQRNDLAVIESFFHGKSSGEDALTCHAGTPLYFTTEGNIRRVEFKPSEITGGYRLFLLDSGERLETEALANHFQEEMNASGFSFAIRNEFQVINQKLIEILLGEREADPAMLFRAISDFQFTHFRKMIPDSVIDAWIEGQVSNDYYLKIQGSGGGFMLGITHESSMHSLEERFKKKVIWIE